jgi:hypothetical protein
VDVDAPRGELLNVGRTEIDEEGADEEMGVHVESVRRPQSR